MNAHPGFWMLTVDRRTARILRGDLVQHGRLHVEEVARLEEQWDERQHGHPSPRVAQGGHTNASEGNESRERLQRFAAQVATWLDARIGEFEIARLQIFAARRFLGALRKELGSGTTARVVEHSLDLAPLTMGELAVHPAVTALPEVASARADAGAKLDGSQAGPGIQLDKHLLYEQAAIRAAIEDLRGELERLRLEPGPGHTPGRLTGMLLMFSHQLRRHFEFEERSGLFGDLVAHDDDLDARLTTLVDAVERSAAARAPGEERAPQEELGGLSEPFVTGLRSWLADLSRHEQAKREIVQELAHPSLETGG